jgi:hypothetical protein
MKNNLQSCDHIPISIVERITRAFQASCLDRSIEYSALLQHAPRSKPATTSQGTNSVDSTGVVPRCFRHRVSLAMYPEGTPRITNYNSRIPPKNSSPMLEKYLQSEPSVAERLLAWSSTQCFPQPDQGQPKDMGEQRSST